MVTTRLNTKIKKKLSVYLDTAYFAENNKKIIFRLLFTAENTVALP